MPKESAVIFFSHRDQWEYIYIYITKTLGRIKYKTKVYHYVSKIEVLKSQSQNAVRDFHFNVCQFPQAYHFVLIIHYISKWDYTPNGMLL